MTVTVVSLRYVKLLYGQSSKPVRIVAYGNPLPLGADQSGLDVEAGATTTTTCRSRVSDNLELASYQLHRVVNLTSF